MKTILLALTLLTTPLAMNAQTTTTLQQRVRGLEDRAALKALVDTFSNLADRKDTQAQTLLFTEDATVESYQGAQRGSSFKGRKQIGDAFAAYLALFETVYHLNGQQTVTITGDKAAGTAYCLVVLIGKENGKTIKNTSGVIYTDEYVRQNGRWLIAKRTSQFTWGQREELPEAR